jgi:hypothetical protein
LEAVSASFPPSSGAGTRVFIRQFEERVEKLRDGVQMLNEIKSEQERTQQAPDRDLDLPNPP